MATCTHTAPPFAVTFTCPKEPAHQWYGEEGKAGHGRCPVCPSRRNLVDTVAAGSIASQWCDSLNGGLSSSTTPSGSAQIAWWHCPAGPDHVWAATPNSRLSRGGTGCPYCAGKRASVTNNLAQDRYRQLALQWHPTNGVTPAEVVAGSAGTYWWRCTAGPDHEWIGKPVARLRELNRAVQRGEPLGCPVCSGRKVVHSTSFAAHPRCSLLHVEQPTVIDMSTISQSSLLERRWQCPTREEHVWMDSVKAVARMKNPCPYCDNRLADERNSLASTEASIALQWHPIRNHPLTPDQVVRGSGKRVWWKCLLGHEWEQTINARTNMRSGCPECCVRHTSFSELLLREELRALHSGVAVAGQRIDASRMGITDRRRWPTVDILLPEIKLVVEYDGSYYHADRFEEDVAKTALLRSLGYHVIRVRCAPLPPVSENDLSIPDPRGREDLVIKEAAAWILRRVEERQGVCVPGLEDYESGDSFLSFDVACAAYHALLGEQLAHVPEAAEMPELEEWAPDRLPEVLRAWRSTAALDGRQAAAKLNVPYETYRNWELGRTVPQRLACADALTEVLEVDTASVRQRCGKPALKAVSKQVKVLPVPPDSSQWKDLGFGPTVKLLRLSRDWTLRHLGDLLGVGNNTLWSWEAGQNSPRKAARVKVLEEVLGVSEGSLQQLLFSSDELERQSVLADANSTFSERRAVKGHAEPESCACGRVGLSVEVLVAEGLPHLIRHRRIELGLTQDRLGGLLHSEQVTVSLWERGERTPLRTSVPDLASALSLDVKDVLAAHPEGADIHPFSRLLLEFRWKHDLTQAQAASRFGRSQVVFSKWERGKAFPWPKHFPAVAKVLDVDGVLLSTTIPKRVPGRRGAPDAPVGE